MMDILIPDDMNNREIAKKFNAKAAVSIEDMLKLLTPIDTCPHCKKKVEVHCDCEKAKNYD